MHVDTTTVIVSDTNMHTIRDLITQFGGCTKFGELIGKRASTASEMKRRNSIPVEYWPTVVKAAQEKGVKGVSLEKLVEMHLRPRAPKSTEQEAA